MHYLTVSSTTWASPDTSCFSAPSTSLSVTKTTAPARTTKHPQSIGIRDKTTDPTSTSTMINPCYHDKTMHGQKTFPLQWNHWPEWHAVNMIRLRSSAFDCLSQDIRKKLITKGVKKTGSGTSPSSRLTQITWQKCNTVAIFFSVLQEKCNYTVIKQHKKRTDTCILIIIWLYFNQMNIKITWLSSRSLHDRVDNFWITVISTPLFHLHKMRMQVKLKINW